MDSNQRASFFTTLWRTLPTSTTSCRLKQIELDARLKREKTLSAGGDDLTLGKERIFIPPKQRKRLAFHFHYPVTENFGPEPKTKEEQRKKWKLIADYMKESFRTSRDSFSATAATAIRLTCPMAGRTLKHSKMNGIRDALPLTMYAAPLR
jgi:hypothetical protein